MRTFTDKYQVIFSIILISVVITSIVSCHSSIETEQNQPISEEHDYADKYIVDSITIIVPDRISRMYLSERNNRLFYLFAKDSLIEYHLDSPKYKPILFKHDLYSIIDFYPINEDSIFLLSRYSNSIYLINNKAEIKKQYKIPLDIKKNTVYAHGNYRITLCDSLMFLSKTTSIRIDNFYKSHHLLVTPNEIIYDIKNERLISIDQYMLFTNEIPNNKFVHKHRLVNKSKNIIMGFDISDTIYIRNIYSKNTIKKIIKSKYCNGFTEYDTLKFNNFEYNDVYYKSNDRYMGMEYDKFKNIYYRTIIHRQNGEENAQDWSLIICDSNFNIIREVYFPKMSYDFRTFLTVTPKGLMIEEYKTAINPINNVHKFKIFDFSK